MNIAIYSPWFHPSVGGIENVMLTLAEEFVSRGHGVKVATSTPGDGSGAFDFEVLRRPGSPALYKMARWCDVFFQANLSLRGLWPVLLLRRPFAVTHQGWYFNDEDGMGWLPGVKLRMTRRAVNISASHAIAGHIKSPSAVIPNPYREDTFHLMPEVARRKDLIFLGRLVSDKGCDTLLGALGVLRESGLRPGLTVVGAGPEEGALRRQAGELGLDDQVDFMGLKKGRELAEVLNAHDILVAPSRVQEGFGIVALEGIACGCVVVGSNVGGLGEAIGPCGLMFPNGDAPALARTLSKLISDRETLKPYRAHAAAHLARHRRGAVADAYLEVFERAVRGFKAGRA